MAAAYISMICLRTERAGLNPPLQIPASKMMIGCLVEIKSSTRLAKAVLGQAAQKGLKARRAMHIEQGA
jgi:hypothetical protein